MLLESLPNLFTTASRRCKRRFSGGSTAIQQLVCGQFNICKCVSKENTILIILISITLLTYAWLIVYVGCKILFYFFQSETAVFPPWQSREAEDILLSWVVKLAGVLGMLTYFFIEANDQERCALAPTIWTTLYRRLLTPLGEDSDKMSQIAGSQGVNSFNTPDLLTNGSVDESSVPVTSNCRVCLDNKPTVALRPCGHVFCRVCAVRVHRCPVCRATALGHLQLFF